MALNRWTEEARVLDGDCMTGKFLKIIAVYYELLSETVTYYCKCSTGDTCEKLIRHLTFNISAK